MANGDRRNVHYLYPWQTYLWARNPHGVETSGRVALPTVGSISGSTALVSVTLAGFGGDVRLVYGRRSNDYECRTVVRRQATPGTVQFRLLELVPSATYYVLAIATGIGGSGNGGDLSGVPVCSPEATFGTSAAPMEMMFMGDGSGGAPQDGPMQAQMPSGDGEEVGVTV